MSDELYSKKQALRHSHSICLKDHNLVDPITGCPKFPVRSAKLLSSKQFGPALPALPVDISKEIVEENDLRRNLHSLIIQDDPHAFKR